MTKVLCPQCEHFICEIENPGRVRVNCRRCRMWFEFNLQTIDRVSVRLRTFA